MPAWLTYDSFAPLVGATFTARLPDGAEVALVLAEAQDSGVPGGSAPDGSSRTQFSLIFRGPADVVLGQGSYELTTEVLGRQPIFLVPVRADSRHRDYEAVFS